MHHHKQETLLYQGRQAIRQINQGKQYSAMTFICSIEQTALHCGLKKVRYLAPKAYLLVLCGFDLEATMVLQQILKLFSKTKCL